MGTVDCDNGPEGKRIELFDYTTKNIISIKDTKKLFDSTIAEVKQLPCGHKKWCISNRAEGVFILTTLSQWLVAQARRRSLCLLMQA